MKHDEVKAKMESLEKDYERYVYKVKKETHIILYKAYFQTS